MAADPPSNLNRRDRLRWATFAVLLGFCTLGCATPGLPPVADRSPSFEPAPSSYRVRPGDTLYSIAWRFELDAPQLARWNALPPPFRVRSGQRLTLKAPAVASAPVPKPRGRSKPAAVPRSTVPEVWRWPLAAASPAAAIETSYGPEHRGLLFRLPEDRAVRAAASGDVVYAGNGLAGFEQLVILRHGERFLSAYSFNGAARVREGDRIKVGAPLADISVAGNRARQLYFELRQRGRPVDPKTLIR